VKKEFAGVLGVQLMKTSKRYLVLLCLQHVDLSCTTKILLRRCTAS